DSAVSVASVSPRYIGDTKTLTATLTRKSDKLALSGRTLTFKIDGTAIGTANTDGTGKATLSYKIDESFGLGVHTLTVEFGGDANYNSSAGSTTLTIKQTPTKLTIGSVSGKVGSTVYLKAKLLRSSDNAVLEGRTVRFQIDGADVGAGVTDGSGLAVLGYVIPNTLSAGVHTITVLFDGDALYLSSSSSGATLTVK
ncbi:MAG: Ig-like domain-containing protein, partial [Armatimonadetes bacterium]|nr:Ig-like domain-containing protein [Armatimonadota bacterium]